MAHAAAGGSGETSNEADDRLAVGANVVSLEVSSTLLLGRATDLTDHDDTLGLGVLHELAENVDEVSAVERITTDADASALAKTNGGGLVHGLISEGTRAGDDTNAAGLVDVGGHDTDLAFAGLDDAGAVRSDEAGLVLANEAVLHKDHVGLGDTFSDADNEGNLSINGLHDSSGGAGRGHVDDSGVGAGLVTALLDAVEDGETKVSGATYI